MLQQGRATPAARQRLNPGLEPILRRQENLRCADCGAHKPSWASVKLGVFICVHCSGIHRKMGVHISFVQSCTIDVWKEEWIHNIGLIGNRIANAYYEHTVPSSVKNPKTDTAFFQASDPKVGSRGSSGDTMDSRAAQLLEKFIRNKYEALLFVPPLVPRPPAPWELLRQGQLPQDWSQADHAEEEGEIKKPGEDERCAAVREEKAVDRNEAFSSDPETSQMDSKRCGGSARCLPDFHRIASEGGTVMQYSVPPARVWATNCFLSTFYLRILQENGANLLHLGLHHPKKT